MAPKHKLIGIRNDLLDMIIKFKQSERINFGESQIGVCIDSDHMDMLVRLLRQDVKDLESVLEGM